MIDDQRAKKDLTEILRALGEAYMDKRSLTQDDLIALSTPEQKCIGLPEQKYISDAGKKAPEPGAFSSDIRLGSDYLPACPSWHGVSSACSD